MTTMTDKEMAEILRGNKVQWEKLQEIADRLDPPSKRAPVTEAHVGCPVVRKFSAGALLFPRDTDPQAFVHPERYKIAITHRHDRSEECPVDPDDCVIVQQDRAGYVFTDVASEVSWESIIGYSIIDVVPLQEVGDET